MTSAQAAATPIPASNFDFLSAIFGASANDAFVTGFEEDPTGQHTERTRGRMWRGQRWGDLKGPLPREWNNYYCISTFNPSADPADKGKPRRRKTLMNTTHVIVFDDVGHKVPWENVKLPATFALMTSPGNCQVGFKLTTPEHDRDKVERLINGLIANGLAEDARDPGMRGVTRYVRLPMGTNKKSKYGSLGVVCEMREWHPERTYTIEQIAQAHGIDMTPITHTGQAAPVLNITDEQRQTVAANLLAALEAEGLIIGRDPNAPGKWYVTCPWLDQHQDRDDSGTAFFEPGYVDRGTGHVSQKGGFKCHHGHCEDKHLHDLVSWLREHNHLEVMHPDTMAEFNVIVEQGQRLTPELFGQLARNVETGRIMAGWKNNAEIIMLNDTVIKAAVKFNEFTCRHEITLANVSSLDSLVGWIMTEVERVYECSLPENTIRLMLHRLLDTNRYDPLKEWAHAQAWDGTPRLDNMLIEHAGAIHQPRDYVQAVSRTFMLGAARRALDPGCKFDNMLILEGPQGAGKSTVCKLLAPKPEWAAAGILDVQHKDAVADLLGKLLYEVEELQTFRRSRDIDALKAFLSRTHDRVRLSYRRDSEDYGRRCVFIGTTNKKKYLENDDDTAQRRFWPVAVGARIDLSWFSANCAQLWAEALHAVQHGELPLLSTKVVSTVEGEQIARSYTAEELPWYEALLNLWDDKDYKGGWPSVTTSSAVMSMLGVPLERQDKTKEMQIARVLRALGYVRKVKTLEGNRARTWQRLDIDLLG